MTGSAKEDPDSRTLYETRQLEKIAARWNAKAADWDRNLADPDCHLNEDQAYERFLAELTAIVQRRRRFCSGSGVIDAGCATGIVLARVIPLFAWGVGVDISPEMVDLAQRKQIVNARFVVGDCFNLEASCPKAGAVVSRGVILSHYGHDQAAALLRSARSVLCQGGFVLFDFLNEASRGQYKHLPQNKTYFSGAEVCHLAGEAGFRTTTVYGELERRVRVLLAE